MSFTLACYLPSENSLAFLIKIPIDTWGIALPKVIQEELALYDRYVKLSNLRLFKAHLLVDPAESLRDRALRWLHRQPAGSELNLHRGLTSIFPDGPSPVGFSLDIIVADNEILEATEGLGDPVEIHKKKIKKALDERLERVYPSPLPSEIVSTPKHIVQLLGGAEPNIYLGRPGGPPVAMFSPSLAALQRGLDHLDEVDVTPVDVLRAASYLSHSTGFYDNEAARQGAIRELFNNAIANKGKWELPLDWAGNIKPDATWWFDIFLIMVLELKNTLGLSGDALLQAVLDYSKTVPQGKFKQFREYCNFPIILVGITANRLEISAAVCVGPIYVSKLLTLDLSLGFLASDNILYVARVFKLILTCLENLREYYSVVSSRTPATLSCLYPEPTPVDPSQTPPKLVYKQFLSRAGQPVSALPDLGDTTTVTYIATLGDTDHQVVVKFTARYNKTAHCLLADAQLAPRLHFCEQIIGGVFMVVMDRIDGKSVWQLRQEKKPIPVALLDEVEKALRLLHDNNIVFGDLRDPNIRLHSTPTITGMGMSCLTELCEKLMMSGN